MSETEFKTSWALFLCVILLLPSIPGFSGSPHAALPLAPAAGPQGAISSGPISTKAEVTAKDEDGKEIVLKPGEKIALMFLQAIGSMEEDCKRHINRRCNLDELVAGVISPNWNIGALKFDPAKDPNYKYTITISGRDWEGRANPQHKGMGAFYSDDSHFIPRIYFNPNGPASPKDKKLDEIIISGDIFRTELVHER